jgi:hypothetical protein
VTDPNVKIIIEKSHEIPTYDEKIKGRCSKVHKRAIHMKSWEEE